MDEHRARALVAGERRRIEAALAELAGEEGGARIPDDRLEAEPLAERTVEEQSRFEQSQR